MQEVSDLHACVDVLREDLVRAVQEIVRIRSVKGPSMPLNSPFGTELRDVLDRMLSICADLGFRTKDFGGYAAHAEFGTGDEMVAALGHLDVVPEGDGWSLPPFGADIRDGCVYGRGSCDDKGPIIAALFGAKALMASGLPLRRRVRVIFGCDEESGFGCVKHYFEVAGEERPAMAFTPDGSFPLVFAEKGIANLVVECFGALEGPGLRISELRGGLRANMVPDQATAVLAGDPQAVAAAADTLAGWCKAKISIEQADGALTVKAIGKSAHASTPHHGDNAIVRLARALREVQLPRALPMLDWIINTGDTTGSGLTIDCRDTVSGALTCNLGVAETGHGAVRLTYNVRYPVDVTGSHVVDRARAAAISAGHRLVSFTDNVPLYVPTDVEPARTLLEVYRSETGDTSRDPIAMGGGTYARATPNTVAFGPELEGFVDGPVHEPDERIPVEALVRLAKIYAHALWRLAR